MFTPLQDLFNAYNCTCANGFVGAHCETEIDECLPRPCENDATCIDEVNGYSCICGAEFTVTLHTLSSTVNWMLKYFPCGMYNKGCAILTFLLVGRTL